MPQKPYRPEEIIAKLRQAHESGVVARDAFFAGSLAIATKDTSGGISAEVLIPYPLGVPVLGQGEQISDEGVSYLLASAQIGLHVHGPQDEGLSDHSSSRTMSRATSRCSSRA